MLKSCACIGLLTFAVAAGPALAAPANDLCENATPIGEGALTFNIEDATRLVSTRTCDVFTCGDIWYLYTPSDSGLAVIDTCDTNLPLGFGMKSILAVQDSCSGAELACNAGSCNSSEHSILSLVVTAGVPILIRIESTNGCGGDFPLIDGKLKVSLYTDTSAPANDACATAAVITPGTPVSFTNISADTETTNCATSSTGDVWFAYTATQNGAAYIDACDSDLRLALSVYSSCGAPIPSPLPLTCGTAIIPNPVTGCRAARSVLESVTAGTTYYIRAATSVSNVIGQGTITVTEVAVPSNDICANALPVSEGEYAWSNIGATDTTAYLGGTCGSRTRDIWFVFTATVDGTVSARSCAVGTTPQNWVMSFHSACGVNEYPSMCKTSPCASNTSASMPEREMTAGEQVYIRIASPTTAPPTIGLLTIIEDPIPANDTCAGALTVFAGTTNWDNHGARTSLPAPTCSSGVSRDVWFSYTSPLHGTLRITQVFLPGPSPMYTIFDSCSPTPVQLGCGTDFSIPVEIGTSYWIRVSVTGSSNLYSNETSGFILTETPRPLNDDCVDAEVVGIGGHFFDNTNANTSGPDATCDPSADGADVWFSYTPAMNGVATFSTCGNGTTLDTDVTAYNNNCASLAEIACNASCGGPAQAELTMNVTGGTAYLVRVSTTASQQGFGTLDISLAPPPCTADFNGVNGVSVQDIFDFLTAWLAGSSSADFNHVNGVTVQDIFDFLTAWLAGC